VQQTTEKKREAVYTPTLLLLILIVGISYLGLGFIIPLRALYGRNIGATSIEIGLMTSSFLIAGFFAFPAVGWLADRFSYRRILWIGLLAHVFLMLAYIPVQNPVLLIALRALEGIESASVLPSARALVNATAPRTRQGEALGVLSASQAVGILIGPVVGSFLANQVGYTPSFLLAGALLGLGTCTCIFLPSPGKRDDGATVTITPHLAIQGLFTRPLLLVYTIQLILQTTQGVVTAIWSLYMLDLGASLPVIGLSYTVFAVPIILLTPISGRLTDRYGRYWMITLGMLLFGTIFCLYSLHFSIIWLLFLSTMEGVSSAIIRSAIDGLLADVTQPGVKGKVQANFSASGTLGSFLGATLAGILYTFAPGVPFLVVGLLCLCTLCILFLPGIVRLFPINTRVSSEKMTTV